MPSSRVCWFLENSLSALMPATYIFSIGFLIHSSKVLKYLRIWDFSNEIWHIPIDSMNLHTAILISSPPFPLNNLFFSMKSTMRSISSNCDLGIRWILSMWLINEYEWINIYLYSPGMISFFSLIERDSRKRLALT